jgi:hypothetical protein
VNLGLMHMAFRSEGIGTSYERHTLNETGRALTAAHTKDSP